MKRVVNAKMTYDEYLNRGDAKIEHMNMCFNKNDREKYSIPEGVNILDLVDGMDVSLTVPH